MTSVSWIHRPTGDRPVLIAAFEGWNDAGDAATTAVEHLESTWLAEEFATIDPEDFFDFTAARPEIRLGGGTGRIIDWPENRFSWARPEGSGGVVLLRGVEPHLKWRTFCSQVIEVAEQTGCSMVVTLGALLAEVAHTRPTPVFGSAYDSEVVSRLGLEPSHYQGPTGIVGVLHAECVRRGIESASLWAAVPSYVPAAPSPKAALALLQRAGELLSLPIDGAQLAQASRAYETAINTLVEEDESTVDYVQHLEEQHDHDEQAVQSADDLVNEVERFLREQ